MTPRKHAALIKAWADGAEIECVDSHGNWHFYTYPLWRPDTEYRIKPEIKPNVVTWQAVLEGGGLCSPMHCRHAAEAEQPVAILRIEINHNDADNPVLVSATLEKP